MATVEVVSGVINTSCSDTARPIGSDEVLLGGSDSDSRKLR